MPQFARPEFSVCQSGVSSSIAVTTSDWSAFCVVVEFVDDGNIGKRRDASPRPCYSKRLTEILKTPHVKTEQAITNLGRYD